MEPEDQAIIQRVWQGETGTFRTLVERHQQAVYNLCYRLLGREEDAQDATQETFLKAYRSLGQFRQACSFKTWLYRIATNECLNRLRKQGQNPVLLSLDEPLSGETMASVPDTAPSPLEVVERKEVQALLHRAINALPLPYRLAITLYHLNQLSYEEIAQAMEVPVGTVKSYLFRGRAFLKSKLERYLNETAGESSATRRSL